MLKECRFAAMESIARIQHPDLISDLACGFRSSNVLPLFNANELAAFALSVLPNHAIVDKAVLGNMLVIERRRPVWAFEHFGHGALASRTLQIVYHNELIRSLF